MRSQPSLRELVSAHARDLCARRCGHQPAVASLYFFGETDRYLQIVAGEPGRDLLSVARELPSSSAILRGTSR
jgi:hypothetical protein